MTERKVITTYTCNAEDGVFAPDWEDIPEKDKKIITEQGGLPCEGGGVPGEWCKRGCAYFGGERTREELYDG